MVGTNNDQQIKQYREKVEAKRKELGEKPKIAYDTNGVLPLDGNKFNLNILRNLEACVDLASQLIARRDAQDTANEILGTDIQIKLGGFTIDQWLGDIKLRVQTMKWDVENKKLQAMDAKLAELLSDDAKTADAIADIAGELGL